ncbi:hypothetical protein N9E25_10235 [Verrucomicrobiales bacterium]|nr:hypothetical protein [Verrucomicrobiales bacterium]MDB2642570.1 hypothetical protein [bacterium]
MAKEFKVGANAKLSTIKNRFSKIFPYLTLNFYNLSEVETLDNHAKELVPLDVQLKIRDVRTKKNTNEFIVVGQTKVGTAERRFVEDYGLFVQVCVKHESGQEYHTPDEFDDYTLSKLNSEMEAREGFEPYV